MSIFKLQQFSIIQRKNAMKVCTDSLIFGSMIPIKNRPRVLDVGTGTGILSLMAMQLGAKSVTAIELIENSAIEAQENITHSKWQHDIKVQHCDFNTFHSDDTFDLIISNPPFFDNHLKNSDLIKNTARHTDTLNYQQLMTRCNNLMSANGLLYLLLPIHAIKQIKSIIETLDLALVAHVDLITMKKGTAKLASLTFEKQENQHVTKAFTPETLTIYDSHQQYSKNSARLLNQFLLRFKA